MRPTLTDFVLKMPRGAQVIYPKDLGPIVTYADGLSFLPGSQQVLLQVRFAEVNRRIVAALLRKAAATSYPHEAAACREKAEALRAKYGL